MIKNFVPQPYEGINPMPDYVSNIRSYTLVGTAPGNYVVTLARLTVGESLSAGNPLTHALFESFTDHGERMKAARTRVSGYDREFIAVKNAMIETGVVFYPTLSSTCEELLQSLGEWFTVENTEITEFAVMSQTCH